MLFLIPTTISITQLRYVEADDLESANTQAVTETQTYIEEELPAHDHDAIVSYGQPILELSDEDMKTWPYWGYGFSDGEDDWKVATTDQGRDSIPDYAEDIHPLLKEWVRTES